MVRANRGPSGQKEERRVGRRESESSPPRALESVQRGAARGSVAAPARLAYLAARPRRV